MINYFISAKFSVTTRPCPIKAIHRRDFCIMVLRLIQGPDLSLIDFRDLLTDGTFVIESKFLRDFENSLKNLYNVGVGYLLDLVEYISRLTIEIPFNGVWCQINRNSILGLYTLLKI